MKIDSRIISTLLLLLLPFPAHAAIWVQSAVSLVQTSEGQDARTDTNQLQALTASTAGYAFLEGFVVGLQLLTSRTDSAGSHRFAWGPKAGLLLKGFELTFGYLPVVRDYQGSDFKSGLGFSLNLGYSAKLVGPLRAGVQLTYWTTRFSEVNGQAYLNKPRSTILAPQLALGLEF